MVNDTTQARGQLNDFLEDAFIMIRKARLFTPNRVAGCASMEMARLLRDRIGSNRLEQMEWCGVVYHALANISADEGGKLCDTMCVLSEVQSYTTPHGCNDLPQILGMAYMRARNVYESANVPSEDHDTTTTYATLSNMLNQIRLKTIVAHHIQNNRIQPGEYLPIAIVPTLAAAAVVCNPYCTDGDEIGLLVLRDALTPYIFNAPTTSFSSALRSFFVATRAQMRGAVYTTNTTLPVVMWWYGELLHAARSMATVVFAAIQKDAILSPSNADVSIALLSLLCADNTEATEMRHRLLCTSEYNPYYPSESQCEFAWMVARVALWSNDDCNVEIIMRHYVSTLPQQLPCVAYTAMAMLSRSAMQMLLYSDALLLHKVETLLEPHTKMNCVQMLLSHRGTDDLVWSETRTAEGLDVSQWEDARTEALEERESGPSATRSMRRGRGQWRPPARCVVPGAQQPISLHIAFLNHIGMMLNSWARASFTESLPSKPPNAHDTIRSACTCNSRIHCDVLCEALCDAMYTLEIHGDGRKNPLFALGLDCAHEKYPHIPEDRPSEERIAAVVSASAQKTWQLRLDLEVLVAKCFKEGMIDTGRTAALVMLTRNMSGGLTTFARWLTASKDRRRAGGGSTPTCWLLPDSWREGVLAGHHDVIRLFAATAVESMRTAVTDLLKPQTPQTPQTQDPKTGSEALIQELARKSNTFVGDKDKPTDEELASAIRKDMIAGEPLPPSVELYTILPSLAPDLQTETEMIGIATEGLVSHIGTTCLDTPSESICASVDAAEADDSVSDPDVLYVKASMDSPCALMVVSWYVK